MEFIRVIKSKNLMIAIIFLLLLNCVSFFITNQQDIEALGSNINVVSDVYKNNAAVLTDPEAERLIHEQNDKYQLFLEFFYNDTSENNDFEDFDELFAEGKALLITKNPLLYEEYLGSQFSAEELHALADFYSHLASQIEHQGNYSALIDTYLQKGEDMSSYSLFSDENSFSYKSIQKSIEDFSGNKDISLSLVNDQAIVSVLQYQIGDFILVLLGLLLVFNFTSNMKMKTLVNTCKKGRLHLRCKQLVIFFAFSFASALIKYISELFIASQIYDAPVSLNAPIQSSVFFSNCVYHLNFLQFMALYILFKTLACAMLALVFWVLLSLSNQATLVSGIAGSILAVQFVLYKNISYQSNVSFLKVFNVFSLFDFSVFTQYNLIPVFTFPIRTDVSVVAFAVAGILLFAIALLICTKYAHPIKTPKKMFKYFSLGIQKLSALFSKMQSVLYKKNYESFKTMHIGKGFLILIIFAAIVIGSFNTGKLQFSSVELFLADYYEEYGGELNEQVYDSVDKMQQTLNSVDAEFELAHGYYQSGEISIDEYYQASAKQSAYTTQRQAVQILTEQIERLESLSDREVIPILMNESGYEVLFSKSVNEKNILLCVLAMIFICSSVFSIEKTSHMHPLIHCTKYGRRKLFFKKTCSVLGVAFVICAISHLLTIFQVHSLYGIKYLNSSIMNVSSLQHIDIDIPIWSYLLLNGLFVFICLVLTSLIVVSLSLFLSQIVTIVVSACAFVLLSLLYMIGVYQVQKLSVIYLFDFNALASENGITQNVFIPSIILLVICFLSLLLCYKNWCNTKER